LHKLKSITSILVTNLYPYNI